MSEKTKRKTNPKSEVAQCADLWNENSKKLLVMILQFVRMLVLKMLLFMICSLLIVDMLWAICESVQFAQCAVPFGG